MQASIISTGNELTEGRIINTNASELAKRLYNNGIEVYSIVSVDDSKEKIVNTLEYLFEKSDIIILTGGLGSTEDDLTREAVATFLNRRLLVDDSLFEKIAKRYSEKEKDLPKNIKKQAMILENAIVIENPVGSAPAQILKEKSKYIILLPGPPAECISIFDKFIIQFLKKELNLKEKEIYKIAFHGITEAKIMSDLEPFLIANNIEYSTQIEYFLGPTLILKSGKDLEKIVNYIKSKYREFLLPEEPLEFVVVNLLKERKLTISIAESCTAGLVGKILTNVPGSSSVFIGSIVAYSKDIKTKFLKVPLNLIEREGTVNEKVVTFMAKNISRLFNTNIGLAVSCLAGPGTASENKPIGTSCFALYDKEKNIEIHECKKIFGDREGIRQRSAYHMIWLLYKHLTN